MFGCVRLGTFQTLSVVGQWNQGSGLFDFERENANKVTFCSVVNMPALLAGGRRFETFRRRFFLFNFLTVFPF
jgi:hypothetical protein